MKPAESLRAVAVLAAFYPSAQFPEQTIGLWAQSIQKFELTDALEAAQILGEGGKWTPALAEWVQAIRECRDDRLRRERLALPEPRTPRSYYPFALFLHEHPAEAEIVKGLEDSQFVPEGKGAENAIVPTLAELLDSEFVDAE